MLAAAGVLCVASGVQAEEPPVALVIESDLDPLELRAAVAEALQREVTTLSRAQASLTGPSIVVTVSIDRDAGISVMYWDPDGVDWLTAPAPADPNDTLRTAASLAAALVLQRDHSVQRAERVLDNPYVLPKGPRRPAGISPLNPYYQRIRGT